jgi:dihydrofolate reductase
MRVVATEYVSLDGVFEEPGEWSGPFFNDEAEQFKLEELRASDALLLGRKTYEAFASSWPSMTDEAGFADKMNSMPKYVVSSTLDHVDWPGSQLVTGNVVENVSLLKKKPGRDLLLSGSALLFNTLRQEDLIDLYRFMVHPIILGLGRRLFAQDPADKTLALTRTETFSSGIVILEYEPVPQR